MFVFLAVASIRWFSFFFRLRDMISAVAAVPAVYFVRISSCCLLFGSIFFSGKMSSRWKCTHQPLTVGRLANQTILACGFGEGGGGGGHGGGSGGGGVVALARVAVAEGMVVAGGARAQLVNS